MADSDQIKIGVQLEPNSSDFQRRIDAIEKQLKPLQIKIQTTGGLGTLPKDVSDFDSYLNRANQRVISFTSSISVLYTTIKIFKDIVSSTIEVDKALGDINSTLKLGTVSLAAFSNKLFDTARATGSTFEAATTAAQLFVRQGLSVQETLKRTSDALSLSRISGVDATEAVKELTTAVSDFGKTGLTTNDVLQKISAATSQFNVSSKDLTDAMARFGATAKDAHVSFDQFLALVTTAKQTTNRDGAAIGTALNTIFTKLEPQKTLDSLKQLGVQVTDVAGHALSTFTVFQNLAKIYEQSGDAFKSQVDKLIGGGRQLDLLKATFSSLSQEGGTFTNVQKALASSADNVTGRLAVQNKELATLLQNFGTAAKASFANIGNQTVAPVIRGALGLAQPVADAFAHANDDAKTGGEKAAKAFAEGFGNAAIFAIGPVLLKAIAGVSLKALGALKNDLLSQAGITTQAQKQELIQRQIVELYKSGSKQLIEQIASMDNLNERAIVLDKLLSSIAKTKAGLALDNQILSETILERQQGRGFAGGYLPIGAEAAAIAAGIGGAPSSASPVVLSDFPLGGGQRSTVVANSSEFVVPNFANGGSAIFNRDMIRKLGLPAGATPIAAGGFVPNAATGLGGSSPTPDSYDYAAENAQHLAAIEKHLQDFPEAAKNLSTIGNLTARLTAPQVAAGPGRDQQAFDANRAANNAAVIPPGGGSTIAGSTIATASVAANVEQIIEQRGFLSKVGEFSKRGNVQFGAALALPFIGGAIDSRFGGQGGTNQGRNVGALTGALNGAGTGLAVGSFFGPEGAPIGAGIGAIGGALIGFLKKLNESFEDVAKTVEELNDKNNKLVQSSTDYRLGLTRLQDAINAGASKSQASKIRGENNELFAQLPADLKTKYLQAGNDPTKLDAISTQLALNAQEDSVKGITTLAAKSGDTDQVSNALAILFNGKSIDTTALFKASTNLPSSTPSNFVGGAYGGGFGYGAFTGVGSGPTGVGATAAALDPLRKLLSDRGLTPEQVNTDIGNLAKLPFDDIAQALQGFIRIYTVQKQNAAAPLPAATLSAGAVSQNLQDLINDLQSQGESSAGRRGFLRSHDAQSASFLRDSSGLSRQFGRSTDEENLSFQRSSTEQLVQAAVRILGEGKAGVGGKLLSGQDISGNFQISQAQSEAALRVQQARQEGQDRISAAFNEAVQGSTNAATEHAEALAEVQNKGQQALAGGAQRIGFSELTPVQLATANGLVGQIRDAKSPGDFAAIEKSITDLDDTQAKALDKVLKSLTEGTAKTQYGILLADQRGKDQIAIAHQDAENSVRLAEQRGKDQIRLTTQLVELQKIESQSAQRGELLSRGTFNLGTLNRFASASAASSAPTNTKFGALNQINANLEQSQILDSLGLPRGDQTAGVEDLLRKQSVLGSLSVLNARKLGRPVGADTDSLTDSANALIGTGTTNNVLLGSRTLDSLKALNFNPRKAATDLLSGGGTDLSTLKGLQSAGQLTTGEGGIIKGVSESNDLLKSIDKNIGQLVGGVGGGAKPVAVTTTTIDGIPVGASAGAGSPAVPAQSGLDQITGALSTAIAAKTGVTSSVALSAQQAAGFNPDFVQSSYDALKGGFGRSLSGQTGDSLDQIGGNIGANLVGSTSSLFNQFATGQLSRKKGVNPLQQFAAGLFGNASAQFGDSAIKTLFNGLGNLIDPAAQANGGAIGLANGGVPAVLTGGEYYVSPTAARNIGYGRLNAMNFDGGGLVKGGSGLKDDVNTTLPRGSFILKQSATQRLGPAYLQNLTSGAIQRHAAGGRVRRDSGGGVDFSDDLYSVGDDGGLDATASAIESDPGQAGPGTGGPGGSGSPGSGSGNDFTALGAQSLLGVLALLAERLFSTTYHTLSPQGVLSNANQLAGDQQSDLNNLPAGSFADLISNGRGGYSIGQSGAPANEQNFSANGGIISQGYDTGGPVGSGPSIGPSSTGGTSVAVTIHNYAAQGGGISSDTQTKSPYGSAAFADQLGKAVDAKVQEALNNAVRGGGFFNQNARYSPLSQS